MCYRSLASIVQPFAMNRIALVVLVAFCALCVASAVAQDALPRERSSCHARVYDGTHLAGHPKQLVAAISFVRGEREIAQEKQWHDSAGPEDSEIAATLRVRFRGRGKVHTARLFCDGDRGKDLHCGVATCGGGRIRVDVEKDAIRIMIGGTLKNGAFIPHYIHLDESCDAASERQILLESGEDDRVFLLPAARMEACR
jgi:hypothetical protein